MKYQLIFVVILLVGISLIHTVSATTYYLNSTTSDLSGGNDYNKVLHTVTTKVETVGPFTILRKSTEESYAWTNSSMPNNDAWETGAFTVKVNVTQLSSTTYLYLNVRVDRVDSAGNVQESSDVSTEQQMTSTGVKTFSIASKDWTDGSATDRLRLAYIWRNSKTNADYTATISQGDVNSYVDGSVTTNHLSFVPSDYANWTEFYVNTTVSLTDFQVSLKLDNRTGSSATTLFYTNGTTRGDWADIVWADTSNTTLHFWKENRTDTATNTTWWIKVPSIADTNTTKIRLFYGNASKTTSLSNGSATFPFFDDFLGSSLDTTTLWTDAGISGSSKTVSNGIVNLTGSSGSYIYSKTANTSGYLIRYRDNTNAYVTDQNFGFSATSTSSSINGDCTHRQTGGPPVRWMQFGWWGYAWYGSSVGSYSDDTWYVDEQYASGGTLYWRRDAGTLGAWSSYTNGQYPASVGMYESGSTQAYSADWVAMRKFAATEPFLTLVVTGGGPSKPVASFTTDKSMIRIPNIITCTDTSTNTPTSWEWSWGDGTANSTTQNPTHQYKQRGKWNIILTATNAGGSGTSGATSVRIVGYDNPGD
jgi:hypothetical protein